LTKRSSDEALQHAVAAQHHGPGEDAHQRVAPERQDDQQEQRLAPTPLHRLGEHVGARESEEEAEEGHLRPEAEGPQHQRAVEGLLEEGGVVLGGQLGDAGAEGHVAQEAEVEHHRKRQENRQGQPKIGWPRQQRYGLQAATARSGRSRHRLHERRL
jgi:hypothetical protein